MRKALKIVGWIVLSVVVLAVAAYVIARLIALRNYDKQWVVHTAEFPIPFPLSANEIEALRREGGGTSSQAGNPLAGVNLEAVARERAVERGRRLIETRVGCAGCHQRDFGGGVLVDSPVVGYYAAPNLTAGRGGVTQGFTAADWDRAVRHAVRHNGRSSSMPSTEFVNLSDHELSDLVAYISSQPPVDREIGPVRLGPVLCVPDRASTEHAASFCHRSSETAPR